VSGPRLITAADQGGDAAHFLLIIQDGTFALRHFVAKARPGNGDDRSPASVDSSTRFEHVGKGLRRCSAGSDHLIGSSAHPALLPWLAVAVACLLDRHDRRPAGLAASGSGMMAVDRRFAPTGAEAWAGVSLGGLRLRGGLSPCCWGRKWRPGWALESLARSQPLIGQGRCCCWPWASCLAGEKPGSGRARRSGGFWLPQGWG